MTNHSNHVTSITTMDVANVLVKIMCLLTSRQNLKTLDKYNKTKVLITSNVFVLLMMRIQRRLCNMMNI
jgi:hypothetical protein